MISARILTTRNTTFDLDVLIGDEPDALGAARIVPGNVFGSVKATIVGQADMERSLGRTLGPMASGDTLTSTDPAFAEEVLRVLTEQGYEVGHRLQQHLVVSMHDRYESPAQYAALSL